MVFKLRGAFLSLIFTICFFIPILRAAELTIPLPADALKISEGTANFGPLKAVTRIYQSSWAPAKVDLFYKQEMPRAGWANGKDGVFTKNNYIIVVEVNSLKDEAGRTHFSNTISKIPTKEELLALPKIKPDKVNFMPVYPGSVQVFLWDSSIGVLGSYETESSVKEVVFFYKSGMLNYGWSLDHETPIKTVGTASKASLIFRRQDGAICTIRITNLPIDLDSLPARSWTNNEKRVSSPSRTTILVTYNENKKIKS